MAFRTVTGARSCSCDSDTMDGIRSPGARSPLWMRALSRSASCCQGGMTDSRLIMLPTVDHCCLLYRGAALARSFAGVPAWFGRSTQAWWALASADSLVTAPTASELASQLSRLRDAHGSLRP